MSNALIYAIGFLAQAFFSGRILVQWILSERARKVLSPNVFWVFSLIGSILLYIYGWLRSDFAIILGQFITYYIYIWNLNIKGVWRRLPMMLRLIVAFLPVVAIGFMLKDVPAFVHEFLRNDGIPLWLVVLGSAGQVIFTLRFVYQWYYSYRRHVSVLPMGFWIISLVGSATIVCYAIIRLDPVLFLGQSVGFVAYTRNIILSRKPGTG
jgi:lipid-A-disaccharide synthase-like uncharacterized protein